MEDIVYTNEIPKVDIDLILHGKYKMSIHQDDVNSAEFSCTYNDINGTIHNCELTLKLDFRNTSDIRLIGV